MKTEDKRNRFKSLVSEMLRDSYEASIKQIDNALNSGCIDIDQWDETTNKMIIPKCLVTAILQRESEQYDAKETSFERQVKKIVRNIRYFI